MTRAADAVSARALVWLLVTQVAVIAPHLGRLPIWFAFLFAGCALWRLLAERGRGRSKLPGSWLKSVLVLAGTGGILLEYGTLFGPYAGIALLVLAFVLKGLEMRSRRDAYVVVVLGYFVVVTQLLFSQAIPTALYMFAAAVMNTAALIALNQPFGKADTTRVLKQAGGLVAQSTPLMLVLFVVFPRIAPLWSFNFSQETAKTGLSDTMAPGDVSQLSASDELAFRVKFQSSTPDYQERYWRGLVLHHYDGRQWTVGSVAERRRRVQWPEQEPRGWWGQSLRKTGEPWRYEVLLEPTGRRWLFGVPAALPRGDQLGVTRDFRLVRREPVRRLYRYRVSSYPEHRLDPQLPAWLRERELQLPEGFNPRSRARARRWYQEVDERTPALVDRVLRFIREQPFHYTLEPPKLEGDRVDQFLFETRRGFCEHYAGAFVVLMRAAGVPARVVTGYMGGEMNEMGEYLLVHQYDAHAWAEVWMEDRGWVRVDPTAAVAPQRVESGLEAALAGAGGEFLGESPMSPNRYQDNWLITRARLTIDYVTFAWQQWVVDYDKETQSDLLKQLLGRMTPERIGMLLLGAGGGVTAVLGLYLALTDRRSRRDPVNRWYLKFCDKMARCGMERATGEAPAAFGERVAAQYPELAPAVRRVTACYVALEYRGAEADAQQRRRRLARLKAEVKALKVGWRGPKVRARAS